MKARFIFATAAIVSVSSVMMVASPAYAWHPNGKIVKKVQNVTAGGALLDANDKASAVSAKPGDTLKYVIEISNNADVVGNDHNDLAHIQLTDTLPAGIVMADGSSSKIDIKLANVKPKQKVTKEYLVKVTSKTDGALINNEACFTGNSVIEDNTPLKGCDTAKVTVHVPVTLVTPVTPEKPKAPETPKVEAPKAAEPAKLPETGANVFVAATGLSVLTYAGYMVARLKNDPLQIFRRK